MRKCKLAKQVTIVGSLVATTTMTYIPTILYESLGLPENFRYALLVRIVFLVGGVSTQLAVLTALLNWVLAGIHPHSSGGGNWNQVFV